MKTVRLVAAIGLSCAVLVFSGRARPASASEPAADAATVVDEFLPGATAMIRPTLSGGASIRLLAIGLPASAIPGGLTELQQQFAYHDVGWRARVAAALVHRDNPSVTSYTVRTAAGTVPSGASDDFHGGFVSIGTPIPDRALDSVPLSLALQQLRSNLAVLEAAMPSGSVTHAAATSIPASPSNNQYALEANVTVAQASDLVGFYGDVIEGLQTGLTGDATSSVVEGLAIVVDTADGTPVVGSWEATRSHGGVLQYGDPARTSEALQVTRQFQNLTGGPSTLRGALGSPSRSARGTGAASSVATSPHSHLAKQEPVASQVHTLHNPGHGGGLGLWWAAVGVGALAVVAGVLLRGLRPRHARHRQA